MHARALVVGAGLMVLAGCGGSPASQADSSQSDATTRTQAQANDESCRSIAAEYATAIAIASSCDPADSAACSVQRPVAVGEVLSDGHRAFTGLSLTANAGYVSPSQTGQLDSIVSRYQAAGCVVENGPGPGPHEHLCLATSPGAYSCN